MISSPAFAVVQLLDKCNINSSKLAAVATDSASAMVGKNNEAGSIGALKRH